MTPNQRFNTMREWSTPEGRLQGVCDVLNANKDEERGRELVALLKEWMAAPSLAAMLRDNLELGMELYHSADHPIFKPSKKRRCGVYQTFPKGPHEHDDRSFTIWMFAHLVTNPLCEKLAGPCARCKKYFIKKRASQNVYCSRRCGNAATAVARTRDRIKAERKEKLARAKAALREWRKVKPEEDWKTWVAKQTGIDPRFLTRAVKKDLKAPKERKVTV